MRKRLYGKEILEQKAKDAEEVMNDSPYVPMKAKELAMLLGIPKSQRERTDTGIGLSGI